MDCILTIDITLYIKFSTRIHIIIGSVIVGVWEYDMFKWCYFAERYKPIRMMYICLSFCAKKNLLCQYSYAYFDFDIRFITSLAELIYVT